MDWTMNDGDNSSTPEGIARELPHETPAAPNNQHVTEPHIDDPTTEPTVPIVNSPADAPRGVVLRTGAAVVGALVVIAAVGGSGFVIGHYVDRNASRVAFGNIPNGPNFPNYNFNGPDGSIGNAGGGSVTPTLPAHSPSASAAAAIAQKVNAGVVDISTTSSYQGSSAAGTGMVLSSDGLVLTNNHVINGATSIQVRVVSTGQTYNARVLGYSVSGDVALLQLSGASGLATVTTTDSSSVTNNQPVVAIGNAGGVGGTPSFAPSAVIATHQSLSASDPSNLTGVEKLTNMIQVAGDIQPGDSGGPLVNTQGRVIGMDTAGSTSGSGFGLSGPPSNNTQGYAIPINTALSIVRTIQSGHTTGSVHVGATPMIGVEISPTLSGYEGNARHVAGVTIAALAAGTPAASSGLAAGDVITALNDQHITNPTGLSKAVQKFAPGDSLNVTVITPSGTSTSVKVTLVAGPAL